MATTGRRATVLLALLAIASGCQTFVGGQLVPIEPLAPSFRPSVEHTTAEFVFVMNDNEPKPSSLDGKLLGREVMRAWKKRGYIRSEQFVKKGRPFSGKADYNLTLSGAQRNRASFFSQAFSVLTLLISPYTVAHEYELKYVLEEVATGKKYYAAVRESDRTQVELFLIVTLPMGLRGHGDTAGRMADHLYHQFHRQGAFQRGQTTAGARQ